MNTKCPVANHVTPAAEPEPGTEKAFGRAANVTWVGRNILSSFSFDGKSEL